VEQAMLLVLKFEISLHQYHPSSPHVQHLNQWSSQIKTSEDASSKGENEEALK